MNGFQFEQRGEISQPGHKLKWRERNRAYSMVRAAYARYGETLLGMTDEGRYAALRQVADNPNSIDPATLFLILQLAIKLWMWWNSTKTQSPPERPGMGESKIIAPDVVGEEPESDHE